MLSNGPSLNLYKARFSGSVLLSQPTLKIKQAHSLATAKLHSRQSALLVLPDNSCVFPFSLSMPRNYLKSRWRRIVGLAYTDTVSLAAICLEAVCKWSGSLEK